MIVYTYPADEHGCGSYRLIWVSQALKAQGIDVRLVPPSHRGSGFVGGEIDTRTGKVVRTRFPADADVIVLQRPTRTHLAETVPMLRQSGIAVVVDMDDDLDRVDPANPAAAGMRGQVSRQHHARSATQACIDATLVTVSTPALARSYAPHGRGRVLPNFVPQRYLDVPRVDSDAIGWAGFIGSHPADLHVVGPAVDRLLREGIEYFGAGPLTGLAQAFMTSHQLETTGNVPIGDWPTAVAQMGVGMAPLVDTAFNRAKSRLKPLEYSALGVPWVASPTEEYVRFRTLVGVGHLAKTPKDWYRRLKALVGDEALRADWSAAGREACRGLTIEGNAWLWAEAWQYALDLQRKGSTAQTARV